MAAGMLSQIFAPDYSGVQRENQLDDQRLQSIATMDPWQQAGYAMLSGGQMAGRGLGDAVAGAVGVDARTPAQQNLAAVQAAKAQVQKLGFDPSDPNSVDDFYKRVIQILQQQGLVGEAMSVAHEWNTAKLAQKRSDLENSKLGLQADRLRQLSNYQNGRNAILMQKLGSSGSEVVQLLGQLDQMASSGVVDPYRESAIKARIDQLTAGKGGGIKIVQAGDHYDVLDPQGNKIGSGDVTSKPLNAQGQQKLDQSNVKLQSGYAEAKAGYQKQYDAAVALYNSPGLDGITGRFGRLVGTEGAAGQTATTLASGPTRAALALYKQVTGETFLQGLAQLKAASATGSTGLGAVSNIEGEKVQSAAAALSREQDAADLRQQLAIYIQTLAGSAGRLDAAAQQNGLNPIPLRQQALGGAPAAAPQAAPVAPQPAAAAPTAAPSAPATPAAPIRFERVNGKIQRVG